MIVHDLSIDDDLYEQYVVEASARYVPVADLLADRLRRAATLDPRSRYLIIEGRTRERLEEKLGLGALQSAEDLLRKVERLARIKFGDHDIPITMGQMQELQHRAQKRQVSVEKLIEEIWQKLSVDFFRYA